MRKYIYHIASLITLLMLSFCGFAQNGTPANPYPIQGKTALITFAECINTGQKFSFENGEFVFNPNGDIPAHGAGTYFEQTADIDLDGEAWVTIGNSLSTGFRGTYIGGGYKIQHLTLTANNPAMFLYPNGTIQNLTIENPVFNGTINYGGALATFVMGGTIDSCRVTGNNLVFNGKDCGALIGWVGVPNGDKAGEVTISHCSNSCNITSHYQQESFTDYYNSVAGVVACIKAKRYHVTHCFNTGNISSTYRPLFQKDSICFAGVVGRGLLPTHPSEITYCYNTGDITAHCGYLGGVAGLFNEEVGVTNYTRCAIDYCFNTGNITGIPVFHVDNPTAYVYADTNIDVFSLGGVVAPSKTKTRYCFNTGNVTLKKHPHPRFVINGEQGVAGVGSSAEHCFNVGEINNYNLKNGRAAGVSRDTANHCFNAACVDDRNPRYTFSPHNIAQVTLNSVSDAQMSVDGQDGNLYPTSKLMGEFSSVKNCLGEEYWIYEMGLYPRLKWTDTCEWARDIAIVASTPILLSDTISDIHHVTNGLQLTGCDKGVVWKAPAGNCLFVNPTLEGENCIDNVSFHSIRPTVQNICNDPVTVAATWNGDTIKTITLIRRVAATLDTIPINSLAELKALRDGINTGEAFLYGGRKFPRYAEGVTFRLTVDLDMQDERPWIPIGSVFAGSRFSGSFLGGGHTIANLHLDDDSIYFFPNSHVGGLFGMLSGVVRDLRFTHVQADNTVIVAGAVCALMNGGTIENCMVEGRIETTTSNNNFAISGIAGIAGVSLTAHTQDNTLTCRDTIRNCVNYADIITHVRRGTNIASHSAGGIIGHGGVVIGCANAGDISGGAECGYIGGIGGDLTSALRCFNTGRISIAKSPQSIDYYVGGVVGINGYPHTVQYCYNAGPVDGSDRNHVGGIMGEGSPEYCYLSNTVTSTGKHLGSITASSPNSPTHCYYDNQMSPIGGMDSEGSIEGRATTAMLGTALQNNLGVDTNWTFTEGLYPRLTSLLTLNSQLSTVSAMPVLLGTNQTWATAHDNFSMGGCDEHHFWKKIRGSVDVNGCHIVPDAHSMGVLEFAATYDSVPYRHITLKYNLDEAHALIIKNADEFNNMREVINNVGGGYYRFDDNTFHLTVPTGDYIDVKDGGNERFFKLIGDINLSSRDWIPIGGFEESCCDLYRGTPFKGTFDGCGHTIRNLKILWVNGIDTCNRYQGLFGTIDGGTVKNLRIIQNLNNNSISNSAFLCAVNRGTLYNCEIDSCELTVAASKYSTSIINMDTVSLLCAVNDGGLIDSCRVKNSQIVINKNKGYPYSVIGGVCGLNQQGTVQNCQVSNLYFEELRSTANTPATQAVGGICGINFHGQLLHDTIKNSLFLFSASLDHQNIGGICGINGSDDKDENRYTDIPSIVENCLSDSTIIRCDTCVQGSSCKKKAMNFGGIVGMSQGHIVQINSCATTAGSRLEVAADSVGGICGNFIGLGDQCLISNCNNAAPVKGYGYVGGIVGLVTNAILVNNHNTGNVWSAWDATFGSQSSRPSGYYAGGIAGACIRRVVAMTCSNKAKIKADSSYVGGIVGALLDSCELIDCANNSVNDNEPDVIGINQVGGLVGLLGQDAWFGTGYNSVNNGCVNNGSVKGISQVGGLVGYAKEGHLQCEGNNDGTVQGSSMTGLKYGHAEDPALFQACTSYLPVPAISPIIINDEVALKAFRDAVNNGSNSYEGQIIELGDNIYLGNDWIPIGTPKHPFRGTFDGQDHTINFGIYNESNDYQGFFGYMQGTVKNVNFTQCSVIGRNYVGVIAGYCHGTISNCYSYREKVEGEKYVGGLVGMARYSEIQDCFNGNNIVGEQYVGGIVGDFASCKNDNCYGTMKYDLHGGNVSRCYNYGMVRATGDTSHVGGIAGFTSAEVKHCYNSGIVDGKDFVGGLCGLLDGDNLHHCYNAGHVSATGNNKGAVCGSLNLQDIMYNCFYDRQMCTVQDNNASGYNTLKMTGTALRNALGTDYWSYNDNEYPTLKTTKKDSTYFRISVKPLLLPGNMPVDKVVQPFCGVTGNAPYSQVEWSRYGTATETVGTIHLADKDSITLLGCGVDTLKVSHPGYGFERLVPIVVAAKEATVETVHTCGSIYKWNKNNQYYNETGFYTCDTCANKQALDLTITPVTITPTLINSTCETIPDGAVLVSVTGGPGNGFRYTWYNSSNDSIGNTPALTDIPADYYSVTVTDSLYSTCSQTSPITLTAVAPVALTIAGCSESKPYDGTALTGSRFVVTEEGHLPDTIAANKFAVLSNGDTLRVTLISDTLINMATSEDGVIIDTLTISYKGIDHSCHYDVTLMAGMLKVTPRPVVIIVNDASKEVGDPDPEFTGSVPGLINPNDLGTISYSRINNTEEVGNYPDVLTATYTENPNYSVSINMGDFVINCHRFTTKISNWPSMEITGQDECFSAANTNALPSAEQIQAMIVNSNNLQAVDFTIAFKDTALKSSTCDWQWARIYTISTTDTDYYCDVESRALYVSGGDQSDPVRSNAWPWDSAGIPYQNACLGSFNMDLYLPKDTDLFVDCSQLFITHSDVSWGDDRDGWTIQRSYVVSDSCGHTIYDTIRVSGSDRTPPVATNPNVKNNTLWADYVQCLCDSIHVINDIVPLKTLFGLSDECTGNDISLVSKTKTLKTGDHCADTVVVAYIVADLYGNDTTFYHAQFIQDTIGPTFEIVPHDTTLCVDPDGDYGNTVTRVAAEITVTNLHDNCTKLQESFSVLSSMDTSRFDFDHPRGYRITQGESDNGVRHYKQLWTVTDSCGNTTYDSISIHVRPLPKITQITNREQDIIYGDAITNVWIYHQYSDLSITGLSGIGLDSLGCSVEHKKDPNNDEYDRVYGDPEFAVSNATFLVTANSHQGWGCSSVDSTFSINVERRPIVITATDATKKYDGTPLTSNNYTCTTNEGSPDDALVHDDVISRLSFSGSQTIVGSCTNYIENARITAPNDTTIDKTSNYSIDYYPGTLTVTVNDTLIKVIPDSASKVYDGSPLTKTAHEDFTVTGVPEDLTWEATADGKVTNVNPGAGEKAVNAVTSFKIKDADGHDVTAFFTNIQDSIGTLRITPKPLTITAASDTKVYDGTTLTKNSYTHSDLAPGDSLWSVTVTGSQTIAGTSDNVPSAAVIKNAAGDTVTANYDITYKNGTLEVTQKPLTITAGDSSKVYDGSFLTNNTYTHTDLAAGDSLWSVTITGKNALVGESSNVPSDAVIKNAAGDTVTNSYNIHYVNGTLRIKVKALTITTRDSSKVYDGTELICHTYTCTGLCVTDSIKYVNMPSKITYAGTIDNVIGSVDIVNHNNISIAGKDTDVTNCYQIQYIYGKLAVTKKDLTITADSATKVYDGIALKKKSYTHSELVPGDSITTIIIMGSQTVAGSSDNVPEGAHIDNANNDPVTESYNITYVNGTLTVTKKPLTITADGATKEYDGTALTRNTYTHTDLISTDHINSVTVTGSQTLVGSSNNVPSDAVIKNDTLLDITDCYQITYANGTLKVNPNTSEIVVTPAGGSKTYDGTPLTKTAPEDFAVAGVPEGFTWTAKADGTVTNVIPGVGEKPVNAVSDFQILNAAGDTVTNQFSKIDTSATAMLTILPVELTVKANAQSKVYGDAEPALTATVTGVIEGDTFTPTYGVDREHGDNVGLYIITPTGDAAQGNYMVEYDTALFTITPKAANIKVNNAQKTYGESDPTFTGTVTGLLNGNDLGTVKYIRTNTDEAVGTYENVLSATFTANNNYAVTIDSGNFTINCRNVTMKPDSVWPEDLTGQNNCFANADTTGLKDAQEIQKLFEHSDDVTVTITDIATKTDDCDWKWKRVYTITVTGGCESVTDSMSVSGGDQAAPLLTGIWPENIDNVNSCMDDTLRNKLYTNAQVKALFSDCRAFTVDSSVTTTGNNSSWTVTKTYTVKDACGNIYYTADNALPTMSVSGRDRTAPELTGTWPDNITNQNNCLQNADMTGLKDESYIQGLFEDCSGIVTVTFDDDTTGNDCAWTITRTYTVVDGCQNTLTPAPTMSVSGGDKTAPVLTGNWPDNIIGQNNCLANADKSGLKDESYIKTLYEDCSGIVTVTFDDDTTGDDCEWTVIRTYTVMDGCGNALVTAPTMSVSGGNHRKPSFKVPSASAICPNEDGTYDVNPDITGNVSNVFDYCHSTAQLSIDYSDSEVELMSDGSRRIIRTWTVTDACGNDSVQTQVITINPAVEISVTPDLQTIVLYESITPVNITSQHSEYITSAISLNNVATSFADADLEIQWTGQGLQVSGTPADTGTYKLLFTAISDQFPRCYPKQAEASIVVRMMQDTVKVVSDTASKIYDGTPLTCHRYVVTLGQDTIPADEGSNGLVFSVHFHDKLVITPVSSLTNAGTIDNEYTCVLDHPEHYKGFVQEFGTLTVNRASLSLSLDTARAYNGHPFVVTADQLHVTGLAENDTITAGTITTDGYTAGTYVCEEGNFHAFVENGVAVKSGFAINHGLNNYEPDFEVTLTIDPITEGFDCPDDLHIVLTEGTSDTMLVLTESATLTPMVDNVVISNNFDAETPLPVGTHTIVWTLSDDQGNAMTTCEQTVTVEYAPCLGVNYHGHDYGAVRVGPQCWLTEDLRWATGNHSAYNGNSANEEKFGYLYSWYAAVGLDENDNITPLTTLPADDGTRYVQGICPEGWGVCSKADVEKLVFTANGTAALKDPSPLYWLSGYEGTLPNTGFAARGGGWYNSTLNRYEDLMTGYHFWKADDPATTTEVTTTTVIACKISIWCDRTLYETSLKTDMRSVRCIRKVAP